MAAVSGNERGPLAWLHLLFSYQKGRKNILNQLLKSMAVSFPSQSFEAGHLAPGRNSQRERLVS